MLDAERGRYGGRRVAVVGSGHSAKHAVRELSLLAQQVPATTITWIVRRGEDQRVYGNEVDVRLPERGKLGADAHQLVDSGRVRLEMGFRIERTVADDSGVTLVSPEGKRPDRSTRSSRRPVFVPTSVSCARCASTSTRGWRAPGRWPH